MSALIACILLVIYFVITPTSGTDKTDPVVTDPNNDWFKSRRDWLYNYDFPIVRMDEYEPVRLVIIAHTVSPECVDFRTCAAAIRHLQEMYKRDYGNDLPYNFIIGNDGRVYEGRGWNVVGAHTKGYNDCSISVAFIGDYREGLPSSSIVTELQLQRANMILGQGVKLDHIHKDYQVLGAKDLKDTQSPGDRIYNIIRQWPHYAHNNVFKGRSCREIRELFENSTETEINDPEDWFITRQMWRAQVFITTEGIEYQPVTLVVISHTVTSECHHYAACVEAMIRLQDVFTRNHGTDIPYNFIIGNDGRVYEARGWNLVGEHVEGYDSCSISIAFVGDYREGRAELTELQLQRVTNLLEQGVELGHIHNDYQVLGTRDLRPTLSPGENVYNIITQWPQYAHDNVYKDKTCREIHASHENTTTEGKD